MLGKVRKGEEIDIVKLQDYINTNLNTNQTINKIEQYSNGFSNLTYLIKTDQKEYVLRRPPKGAVKRGHDMSREFKVLNALDKKYDIAPSPFIMCDDIKIIGSSFYLMEKVQGIILTPPVVSKTKISPNEFNAISKTWLKSFISLHNVDYKEIGLSDLGKPEGYTSRQIAIWSKQFYAAKTEEIPTADKVIEWLSNNIPNKSYNSLIHNDYKYDNVVFEDNSWKKISSILDWEMCTLGDSLMDLGTSLAYWTMDNDHPELIAGFNSPTIHKGNPSRLELVDMYSKEMKISIENIVFYYVYGLFKIAVIVQQIYYRYHHGMTNNPKFKYLNKSAKLLCNVAWQSIQKNKIENLY